MLGIVGARFDACELHFEPIATDTLVLVMTPELKSRYGHLGVPELLRSLPWVMREEGSGTRMAMVSALAGLSIDIGALRTVMMVRNAGAMARCLAAGMGAAITSSVTVESDLSSGTLVALDVPELRMERQFYVVFNTRRSLFPAAVKLIEFLKTNAEPHVRMHS
jgi:DNA-binding transcriptional LysR family regulator